MPEGDPDEGTTRIADLSPSRTWPDRDGVDACACRGRGSRCAGGTTIFRNLDVTCRDSVQSFADAAVKEFGRIDVIINNAGIMPTDGQCVTLPNLGSAALLQQPKSCNATPMRG